MDFESAKAYLEGFKAHEKMRSFVYDEQNFDLQKLKRFLQEYSVDYSRIKFVHVAGSKGKGTVCNLMANYLKGAGKNVGMFTSPYVLSVRECFWLNGAWISEARFAEEVKEVRGFLEKWDGELTFFEVLVVIALKYFSEIGVQYAVMEVGIGGGLDATNVISSEVAVITRLEEEHMEILGGSREKIVEAKLGIVKGEGHVVVGEQDSDFASIVRAKLAGNKRVHYVGDSVEVVREVVNLLFGGVDEPLLKEVLDETKIVGRFDERLLDGKTVIFDIAHTQRSVEYLLGNLKRKFSERKLVFLVSIMADKKAEEIVTLIDRAEAKIVFTLANEVRGEDPQKLAEYVKRAEVSVIADPVQAFLQTLKAINKNEILVVTGSHFLVSKVLKAL